MTSCPRCVRYTSGPRAGQLFMRCLPCAVVAVGGDGSSLRAAVQVTALADLLTSDATGRVGSDAP